MKPLPIRLKLTAWYAAILLASLSIFGIAAFFAMTKGIEKSVDENLEGQAAGIEELMGRVLNEEPTHLRDDLLERAAQPGLRPRGVLDAALLQHAPSLTAPW